MSCKCHSSLNGEIEQLTCKNNDMSSMLATIKLTNQTMNTNRSFDSFHLIFTNKKFNVSTMFLKELSYLFPQSTSSALGVPKSRIKITLSFSDFQQLHFENNSFYQLFHKHADHETILILELTSNGRITFSPMAFEQLTVDHMFLHTSSLEPYSFEEIFNGTHIGELTIEGSTPRSNASYRMYFNGKIRLAKFTKMVEAVSSEEFPYYPVRSMDIEAHEARRINASAFINYRNLHGLHLIRPRFFFDNESFNGFQYLINLETIELDAEIIKDNAFQHVSRIRFLTLGQNIRYLTEHSLDYLDYLTHFDASRIVLDHLYPSSRCILARFIHKQQTLNPAIIISPPQAEYCDCIYDFILARLNKKPDHSYIDLCSSNQEERCHLNNCNVLKNFDVSFKDNLNDPEMSSQFHENVTNDAVPLYPTDDKERSTYQLPSYVHRRPSINHQSETNNKNKQIGLSDIDIQNSHESAFKTNSLTDPNAISQDDNLYSTLTTDNIRAKLSEERRLQLKNEALKWIALSLVCITILCVLLVGTLIWFFTCRPLKRHHRAGFQLVQANSSNV